MKSVRGSDKGRTWQRSNPFADFTHEADRYRNPVPDKILLVGLEPAQDLSHLAGSEPALLLMPLQSADQLKASVQAAIQS
jgi:hypothetical protein